MFKKTKLIIIFLITIIIISLLEHSRVIASFQPSQFYSSKILTDVKINKLEPVADFPIQFEERFIEAKNSNEERLREIITFYQQGKYQKIIDFLSLKEEKELEPVEIYMLALAYQNTGKLSFAVKYWYLVKQSYLEKENYAKASYCLLQLAQGYIDLGRTNDAITLIENWSYPLPDYAFGIIGNAYLAQGNILDAIEFYQKSVMTELNTEQKFAVLNNLGLGYERLGQQRNLEAQLAISSEEQQKLNKLATKAFQKARETRERAFTLAQSIVTPSAINAKLNWLKYFVDANKNNTVLESSIYSDIEKLPSLYDRSQLLISLAQYSSQSSIYLQEAILIARKNNDNLSLAVASAELGNFYEKEHLYREALTHTQEAIEHIYPLLIDDYLYQYQWQEARIYEELNQTKNAISAYERSLNTLQKIRPQIAFSAKNIQFDFTESIEPIYRGLLKLLLANNPNTSDLQKSLNIFEEFQVVKLENLFADICVRGEINNIDRRLEKERIAVITPIILKDSIHILVKTPNGKIYHHSESISSNLVEEKIKQWRSDLSNITEQKYLLSSSYFYSLIFEPFEEIIALVNPTSIVFVNDGLLRNVPMAALYDAKNKQFLIEKYPLSVALGRGFLSSANSLSPVNNTIGFGLSEPVPPVNVALPFVTLEMQALQKVVNADTQIDREFTSESLFNKVKNKNFSVLHLATHGEFTGLIENSFIQAYDGIITTSELEQILIQARQIDLLTLSACETAAGDNRAVMGLAGVAIRTGIPSVLSTFWSISDSTAPTFIEDFYRYWLSEDNKAIALQKVQIEKIRQESHPSIWSSFILIGI